MSTRIISGMLARKQLEQEVEVSFWAAWAPKTSQNYISQQNLFMGFCYVFGYQPVPATVLVICSFIRFMAREFRSPKAVENYLVGVKWLYVLNNYSIAPFRDPRIKLLLRGIARQMQHMPRQVLPLTPDILVRLYNLLDLTDTNDTAFWALLCLGFHIMARSSNLVPLSTSGFDPDKQLVRADVLRLKGYIMIAIRWSKTNQFGDRVLTVPLAQSTGSYLCPVSAYDRLIDHTPGADMDPLFVWKKGRRWEPITYKAYMTRLRELLAMAGEDPKLYGTHSLRRGGATAANQAGVPRNHIALVGDWRSDAIEAYLHDPMQLRLRATERMRNWLRQSPACLR